MRLPVESSAGRARAIVLGLVLVPALAGCGYHAQLASASAPLVRANGPAADYPVVIGGPYKVGDKLYTPVDSMNYDQVGYLGADTGAGITASHHTLPLPSYAEVTSLKTGHTILVRVERRGPMNGNQVIALSPAALAQLGASAGDPVRVRRVNPPEAERAALRAGRDAPARMDTPASLVAVLKRRLPAEGSADLTSPKPVSPAAALAATAVPASTARQVSLPSARAEVAPNPLPNPLPKAIASATVPLSLPSKVHAATTAEPAPLATPHQEQPKATVATAQPHSVPHAHSAIAADGAYMVQAATMSTLERAQKVAGSIDGSVSKAGRYFRVRTGPFATRDEAEASLAKVRAAGYSDARIFTNG
jgi:rare lipoprotein A